MSKISDFFDKVPGAVNKDKVAGMNSVYQFIITGEDGGEWNVAVAGGEAKVAAGKVDSPSITLTMDSANFIALLEGKLNGQTAFLTGKLKIQGDMTLAMKLAQVFSFGS